MNRRTIALLFLSILLLSFIGCNADATAGLFYQLATAKEPVKIRYKQIVGLSSDKKTLYFLTDEGVFAKYKDTDATEAILKNKSGFIIDAAALPTGTNDLLTLVNGPGNSGLLYKVDLTDASLAANKITVSDYALKGLYANAWVRAEKIDDKSTHFGTINSTTGVFNSSLNVSTPAGLVYDSVRLLSGGKQDPISAANPLLVVYYDPAAKTYAPYYYDGTGPHKLTGITSKPAAFTILDSKLFVLTDTGTLYGSSTLGAETAMTELVKLSREYDANAFMYGIIDGDTYNLITKSKRANDGFTVLKFDKNIITVDDKQVTPINVAEGFGKHFTNVTIVDALPLDATPHTFLIATLSNGMMSVTFTALDADNKNTGSATPGEEYEF